MKKEIFWERPPGAGIPIRVHQTLLLTSLESAGFKTVTLQERPLA
jgi:hypothetical protein